MSLLLLLRPESCPEEEPQTAGDGEAAFLGNLRALLDAIHKEDDRIGGRAVTRLVGSLSSTDQLCMMVESTIGFGENTDGTQDAKLLVGNEIIEASGRNSSAPFIFYTLTRGADETTAQDHADGTLVFDLSRNTSAIDRLRRGFFVNTAVGADLEVIGQNLGLKKCPGLSDEQYRRIIKAIAYYPKNIRQAYVEALQALTDGVEGTDFQIRERLVSDPFTVFVDILVALASDIRGRFLLNAGEPQDTTGALTVDVDYPVVTSPLSGYAGSASQIIAGRTLTFPATGAGTLQFGVYDDTPLTRRGYRDGFTNYAAGGSVLGSTITLGSSPGGAGTPVLVDYTGFDAHYVPANETTLQDVAQQDRWAYLSDPLLTVRCLLNQVRTAGVAVELAARI